MRGAQFKSLVMFIVVGAVDDWEDRINPCTRHFIQVDWVSTLINQIQLMDIGTHVFFCRFFITWTGDVNMGHLFGWC